jgi:hypothetical protein
VSVAEPETLAPARAPGLPALRLLPVPSAEPPYDDELPAGTRLHLVGTASALAPVPVPVEQAPLRLVPAQPVPTQADRADDEDPRTPLHLLPPAGPFAHALVQRLLEVLAGLRPLGQLQRDTTLELYDELERAVSEHPRATGPRPTRRDVRSLHLQEREDGVAEACATVQRGGRVVALAFRLEGRSGSWRCTELLGV